jgi:predicted DNA-binding transcriptional regulator AlpA
MFPELLSATQLAAFLRVSRRSVWRWTASGRLPQPVRFGRRVVRWRISEIKPPAPDGRGPSDPPPDPGLPSVGAPGCR